MGFLLRPTVTETFLARVNQSPDAVAFQYKTFEGWRTVTFSQFYIQCRDLSFGLMSLGLKRGERVAILSSTRYEWPLSDMAILGASAVTVPIYASSTTEDVRFILNHSESRVLIAEDVRQLEKIVASLAADAKTFPHLEWIILLDTRGSGPTCRAAEQAGFPEKKILSLEQLLKAGQGSDLPPARFSDQLAAAEPDDLLTVCYTSGTTGVPKGAMITHDNMMSVLEDCVALFEEFVEAEQEVLLSFLPFSHILGKVESMAIYPFGWRQAFAENMDRLMDNLAEVRPTLLFSVPRTFEKAYSLIHDSIETSPLVYRKLFDWASESTSRYLRFIHERRIPDPRVIGEYLLARNLVFNRVAKRFGGRLKLAVCGGAPLPEEIGETFEVMGLRIREGYGLTETCGPVTLNSPDNTRFGTVGKPLPEVTLKIADDGEILVKSRKVFKGYFKAPDETAEAIQDGWLKTGDIGEIDADGFLRITDRKKDIIITSAGKNIAPQKIENLAKQNRMISELVVIGDKRPYLSALVTLNQDLAIAYANEHQILFSQYPELVRNPRILTHVQRLIDELNHRLASFETIKRFVILPHNFTVEGGELTPSLKIRRRPIAEKYKDLIHTLYGERRAGAGRSIGRGT